MTDAAPYPYPPLTLRERVEEKMRSRGLNIWPKDGNNAIAPTGEHYVIISLDGMRDEGVSTHTFISDEAAAEMLLVNRIIQYSLTKSGTLYWRCPPELGFEVMYRQDWHIQAPNVVDDNTHFYPPMVPVKMFKGYARLLISDRPVLIADNPSFDLGALAELRAQPGIY